MPSSRLQLSSLVHTPDRYLRSINIERDSGSTDALQGYVLSAQVRQILWRLGDSLRDDTGARAWTVTGPYGSGKSAFALFLSELLDRPSRAGSATARDLLAREDPELFRHVAEAQPTRGNECPALLPVLLTGRPAPLSVALLNAASLALAPWSRRSTVARLRKDIDHALGARVGETAEPGAVTEIMMAVASAAASLGIGYTGVLIIVDELGQFLEFAARQDLGGEVHMLQELAESASRSSGPVTAIIGVLHQSFEEYARRLDSSVRNEWAKVQGRFEDIAFQEPPDQMMRLLAASIAFRSNRRAAVVRDFAAQLAARGSQIGLRPSAVNEASFRGLAEDCYPLHPSTMVALPHIFRRFAQNERSLFSYVASLEPYGLQELIHDRTIGVDEPYSVRLYDVFDYLTANLGPALYLHRDARGWAQASDILDRQGELTPTEVKTVKTVGLLSVLERISHLRASDDLVEYCVAGAGTTPAEVKNALRSLSSKSIVVFRKFSRTYRLWEGSDVDIEESLADARKAIHGQSSAAQLIQRHLPPRPFVARRHSYLTGALRYFDLVYVDQPSLSEAMQRAESRGDGLILCCLPGAGISTKEFASWASSAELASNNHLVIAVPQGTQNLSSAVHELQALHWVRDHTPALRDDPVASRELAERAAQVGISLTLSIQKLLDPRKPPAGGSCQWFHRGVRQEVATLPEANELLSRVLDEAFHKSPHIQNELINRRELSSTVAAARNRLFGHLVEGATKESLGIEGYPPERSIYESLLKSTGIHRFDGGRCAFGAPSSVASPGLHDAWRRIEEELVTREAQKVPLQRVCEILQAPPYGMLLGPLPIFVCAFLLSHDADVALYENDSFVPELSAPVLERMARSAEGFDIQFVRVEGLRLEVLGRLVRTISRNAGKMDDSRSQLVETVRQLCGFVAHLPGYAQHTARVSIEAQRVRDAVLGARDPFWLVFRGLPEACGLPAMEASPTDESQAVDDFMSALRNSLVELRDAYEVLLGSIQKLLYDALDVSPDNADGRKLVSTRAHSLIDMCVDHHLRAFLSRISDQGLAHKEWLEGIATLLANRAPKDWHDGDIGRFEFALADLRRRFLHLESLSSAMDDLHLRLPGTTAYRVSITSVDHGESSRVAVVTPDQTATVRDLRDGLRRWLEEAGCESRGATLAAIASLAEELLSQDLGQQSAEARGALGELYITVGHPTHSKPAQGSGAPLALARAGPVDRRSREGVAV